MTNDMEKADELSGGCSLCGCEGELISPAEGLGKSCLDCSADLAVAGLLIIEIDEGTFAGRDTNALVSEFTEISSRMLNRAQSAGRRI